MKRFYDPEQLRIKAMQKLYASQSKKKFNYTIKDFEIYPNGWKHKDWNTWMEGNGNIQKTKVLVEKYIDECKKPYGKRDLSFVHLKRS